MDLILVLKTIWQLGRAALTGIPVAWTLCSGLGAAAPSDPLLPVWAEIRTEAGRGNSDPIGRPLPLAATWSIGGDSGPAGFTPDWQISQIAGPNGHYILPSFNFPWIGATMGDRVRSLYSVTYRDYFSNSLGVACAGKLPITMVGTQWEANATTAPYLSYPLADNPNVFDNTTGTVTLANGHGFVDPMGPVGPWQEAGAAWTGSPIWRDLQTLYPAPSRVILLSNNESPKLKWSDAWIPSYPSANTSKRFVDAYGYDQTDEFKRQFFGDHWPPFFRAMQQAMRDGLAATGTWNLAAKFVGYDAFGPSGFRSSSRWAIYGFPIDGRIDPAPLTWDGGSPSYYASQAGDYQVKSMQTECQNWVFMQAEAQRINPNFWFEMSVWDGNGGGDAYGVQAYLKAGQPYSPDRYKGWIQFGMWINRPRVVREYRGSSERRDCYGPAPSDNATPPWTNTPPFTNSDYFLALCSAVDKVHTSPTLRSFWRTGTLVQNTAEVHPYQDATYVPTGYDDATINAGTGRWFMLTTAVNPARSKWTYSTSLPVYALALVKGTAPTRQWLIYAHCPLMNRPGVGLMLPGYGLVSPLVVPTGGQFWLVDEATQAVTVVNDFSTSPAYNVTGQVVLGGFAGDNTSVPVTVELRGGSTLRQTVALDAAGRFTLANVAPDTYSVWIKAPHWLAGSAAAVTVSANDVADLGTIQLVSGDINGDNQVTFEDFAILQNHYGQSVTPGTNGDLNGDGTVGFEDFAILQNGYGQSGSAATSSPAAASALAALPCGGLGILLLAAMVWGLLYR